MGEVFFLRGLGVQGLEGGFDGFLRRQRWQCEVQHVLETRGTLSIILPVEGMSCEDELSELDLSCDIVMS